MSETAQRANADLLDFCPGCFATNEDGSWGYTCDDHYCYNCGAQGTVKLPRWAAKSIRQQASWVGKRYYPHHEDECALDEWMSGALAAHQRLQKQYEEAMEALREAKEAAEHWSVCDFPDEVDYRCADCNAAQKAVETARALLQRHKEGV